ncbi:hypothetical protein DIPPA_15144 [Diplonema papillatum]|nr:hypothetical protein DIPPA_15144 [Diplonema papillatum]
MSVTVIHDKTKHSAEGVGTVGQLRQWIEAQLGVPSDAQKLVLKGKALKEPAEALPDGCKVMLVGSSFDVDKARCLVQAATKKASAWQSDARKRTPQTVPSEIATECRQLLAELSELRVPPSQAELLRAKGSAADKLRNLVALEPGKAPTGPAFILPEKSNCVKYNPT